jgi:hypothetical protein
MMRDDGERQPQAGQTAGDDVLRSPVHGTPMKPSAKRGRIRTHTMTRVSMALHERARMICWTDHLGEARSPN